jgi:threonine dehydrogenase-like Zn-dependent dehydrogenase
MIAADTRDAPLPAARGRRVAAVLGALERLALACPPLQRRLVAVHARALARLLPVLATCPAGQATIDLPRAAWSIAVVGGGLFPRTALALARVWPAARVTIVDADADHLERARRVLATHGAGDVTLVHATWDPRASHDHDLVILPLALVGDRDAVYTAAGAPRIVHDWLWRPRGRASAVVAWWLLKRVNLVVDSECAHLRTN